MSTNSNVSTDNKMQIENDCCFLRGVRGSHGLKNLSVMIRWHNKAMALGAVVSCTSLCFCCNSCDVPSVNVSRRILL